MGKTFLNNSQSRGLRNNNPGNIRRTTIAWQGKIPHSQSQDTAFEQFFELKWGLRALIIDIRSKINGGYNTVEKIINRYAPPTENNTSAYINNVASWSGYNAVQALTASKTVLMSLAKAIVTMELGTTYASKITASDYDDAWWLVETGYEYGDSNLPELVIEGSVKKKCEYCGHVIAIIALFFFTYFSIVVV